ncbi:MAG: 2-oxo acid dehydrogenase subunit E2, partial [Natronomonas sp.]
MAFEYELPDVGEGVAEGEIVAWHVEPGDHVEEDDVLAEVETDKAVVDLPAPVTGTIRELHAEEGEVVPVGDVVVTIDVDGESEGSEATDGADAGSDSGEGTVAGTEVDGEAETDVPAGRVFAPPNVRRLARELGVDVAAVEGSGPSGRVTESDVRAAAESPETEDSGRKSAVTRRSDSNEPATASTSADRDRTLAAPATRKLAADHGVDIDEVPTEKRREGEPFVEPEDVEAYVEAGRAAPETTAEDADVAETAPGSEPTGEKPVSTEPYRGVRRTIGTQMQQSASTIPHATHHDKAVVEELVETRADLKARAADRGISLTYMPFVLKAVVAALKEHPVLNSELDEENEQIRYKQ